MNTKQCSLVSVLWLVVMCRREWSHALGHSLHVSTVEELDKGLSLLSHDCGFGLIVWCLLEPCVLAPLPLSKQAEVYTMFGLNTGLDYRTRQKNKQNKNKNLQTAPYPHGNPRYFSFFTCFLFIFIFLEGNLQQCCNVLPLLFCWDSLFFLWENPPEIIKKGKQRSINDVCFLHSEKQTNFHSWKPSHSLHLWKLGQLTAISLGWVNSIQTQAPYQVKRVTRSMLHYYMCIMTFGHTNTVITYCPTSLIWLPESSSSSWRVRSKTLTPHLQIC